MNIKKNIKLIFILVLFMIISLECIFPQAKDKTNNRFPVKLDADTLFYIYTGIGIFDSEKRVDEINAKIKNISTNDDVNYDSIKIVYKADFLLLQLLDEPLMAITKEDALISDTNEIALAEKYSKILKNKLKERRENNSTKNLIKRSLFTLLNIVLLALFIWLSSKTFPWLYLKVEQLDKVKIGNIKFKEKVIVQSVTMINALLNLLRALRFILALFVLYIFITQTLQLWPYTRKWDLEPIIKSIGLLVFYTAFFLAFFKSINSLIGILNKKYEIWKGSKIKSFKIKTIELLSADRTVEFLTLLNKIIRFATQAILFYTYITIVFHLFTFSQTWSEKLLSYVMNPLYKVMNSFIVFLPNIFFILVIVFVFYYIIRFVRFFFMEMSIEKIEFPGFPSDWAMPTFKIVRFLILILGAIVIFPYLPGSDSPFFQGISVFIGILFSLGSTSAIANMVAGIVLTYMRPFKLGDRVKIADTIGDVVEKTLLVTRIRTIKNVDITIPNAMVLGTHIINYSSSAADKGLILHTTITIGYDVPWKQVHSLLIAVANESEYILKEPKPFVLQTSLDDFYVSYELNAYTNNPHAQSRIYSDIHSKIQDKFNEAGVEIMSPHYNAMRDGNQTTIPQDYLPKDYQAPQFKIFGENVLGSKPKETK